MNLKIVSIAAFVLLSVGLSAQPREFGGPQGDGQAPHHGGPHMQMPPKQDPAEMAAHKADMMQREVGLDDKQYKKVYKLFKKDYEYRADAMEMPEGGFPGGFPGGQGGFPGGGPGMGGPGGGFPGGGPGMGGPGMGGPGGGFPGGPGMGAPMKVVDDEYLEKQDKKLRKILTAEQYEKWDARHPREYMELPPIEMF